MDTLISNVTAVTMNPRMEVIFGAYIGIENGKIVSIERKPPAEAPKAIVDGTGMVAIPGLINCHTHLATASLRCFTDDLGNTEALQALLQKEAELQEIVKLVGQDALSPADNLTLESAKMIREDFLQQNAFLENDQYSSFDRQARLLDLILRYKDLCDAAIERGADIWKLYAIAARAAIGRAKTVPADTYQDVYAKIVSDMEQQIEEVAKEAEAE